MPPSMTGAAEVPGCPVDESFDPLSAEFLADPYAVMAKRPGGGAPVFFAPSIGYYVVASYEAVEQVFRDPARSEERRVGKEWTTSRVLRQIVKKRRPWANWRGWRLFA